MKKKRIRIHKQTLRQLNNPCYIQFLVNPDRKTIAIKVCGKNVKQAHKINYDTTKDCDFYSKELLYELGVVSPELITGHTYRLQGKLVADKGLALFFMDREINDVEEGNTP